MAQEIPDWNILFNDDKFIKAYRLGERATGRFAQHLIDQSGIIAYSKSHQDRPLVVLDNACGTGIVSSILQCELDEQVRAKWQLTCGDLSDGMLEYTRRRVESEKWLNVEVKTVDAQDTKLPSEHFSHVFTAFGM
jgi:ubiquinone/menaquinone biosynthesis C-methylase UbiE